MNLNFESPHSSRIIEISGVHDNTLTPRNRKMSRMEQQNNIESTLHKNSVPYNYPHLAAGESDNENMIKIGGKRPLY